MPCGIRAPLAAAVAVFVVVSLTASAQGWGRWVTGKFAPLPAPEEEYTAVVSNNRLYLIGGNIGGRPAHPRHVLEYDLAADKWTSKKPVPFSGDHMTAADYRGRIYVFGGQGAGVAGGGANKPFDIAWEYDPAGDAWKPLAPMPTRRTAASAVEVDGRIYVIGGNTDGGLNVGTNEAYDPATNRWETKRPMPTARNHAAAGAVGGKIYLIGGRLAAPNIGGFLSSNTDIVEEYDPATDRWRPMTKMPTPRSGHGFTTYEGRIYVAGGEARDAHSDAIFRDLEAFDPVRNDWLRLPPMPTARHGVNLAAYDNRIHAIGGHLAFAATGGEALHTPAHEVFELNAK
jgi:N-acetylneuraminic acid mutarotase